MTPLYQKQLKSRLRGNLDEDPPGPLKGGGRGVHPDYFVKLDFEIAVDQQTRARDRTFEGVPDSG